MNEPYVLLCTAKCDLPTVYGSFEKAFEAKKEHEVTHPGHGADPHQLR